MMGATLGSALIMAASNLACWASISVMICLYSAARSGLAWSAASRAARSCWNSLSETKAAGRGGVWVGAFAAEFPGAGPVMGALAKEGLVADALPPPPWLIH